MALTPKQSQFAKEYLIDLNATQAAIRAGFSEKTADQQGSRLLTNVKVKDEIQRLMALRSEKTQITSENVILELAKLGFGNIRNLYDNTGRLIPIHELKEDVSATITEVCERVISSEGDSVVMERKYKIADKRAALVDIGKHLGMFDPKKKEDDATDWDSVCRAMAKAVARS